MKKKILILLSLMILLGTVLTVSAADSVPSFQDITPQDYFYEPVLWAYENDITTGPTDTMFSPYRQCTRAQTVTFLWRAAGCPRVAAVNPFTDILQEDYFYQAVLWAYANDITKGTSPIEFSPYDIVTRGQFVTFLYRYAGAPGTSGENPFHDNLKTAFYYDAVIWANDMGITTGATPQTFRPGNPCTRAQTVTFLYRYANMKEPEKKKLTSEEISQKCASAVFFVSSYYLNGNGYRTGSGFFISSDGYAITNLHVVRNSADILIRTIDGEVYGTEEPVQIIDFDRDNDLALIKVPGTNFNYLEQGDSDAVRQGQVVYAFGNPRGLANTMSQGIIANPHRDGLVKDSIQISVETTHGSSGGALVDEYGKVIGVTNSGIEEIGALNFAVPINRVAGLDRNRVPGDNPEDRYGVALDIETYEKYSDIPDFGYITGGSPVSHIDYVTYRKAAYPISDFCDLNNYSAEERLKMSLELYAYALELSGMEPVEVTEDKIYYKNDSENVVVVTSPEDEVIYVSYGENSQHYVDEPYITDFGWFSGLPVYSHKMVDGSNVYTYDYSNTYSSKGIVDLVNDYLITLVDNDGFTYYGKNAAGTVIELQGHGLSLMIGFVSGRYVMLDILPLEE